MKVSVLDKEKNDLVREEDGSITVFADQDKAVGYLQDEGLKDEWIKSNFVFLKRTQPLIPDVMAFKESQIIEFFRCKNCGEEFNTSEGLKIHACETSSHPEQGEQGEQRGFYLGEVLSIAKEIAVDFAWENFLDKTKGYQHFRKEFDTWLQQNKYINDKVRKLSSPPPEGQDERIKELENFLRTIRTGDLETIRKEASYLLIKK